MVKNAVFAVISLRRASVRGAPEPSVQPELRDVARVLLKFAVLDFLTISTSPTLMLLAIQPMVLPQPTTSAIVA